MATLHTPNREEQALVEVGHTEISRLTAFALLLLFLLTIGSVPVLQAVLDWRSSEPHDGAVTRLSPALGRLAELVTASWPKGERIGPDALADLNRRLLSAIGESEDLLEETSLLRERALPRLQWIQTRFLGVGNEQAYLGRSGWLFYRADLDYVVGPGFLEPDVLGRRSRGGDMTERAPVPDPRPALASLDRELSRRGVRLIVMPTPVKPSIHPEAFSGRVDILDAPVGNVSFPGFLDDLADLGIEVFDPAPLMARQARDGQVQFLETDTHWTPESVELVAAELARLIEAKARFESSRGHGYLSREVVVDGRGDIAAMLRLPDDSRLFPRQQVRARRVLEPDGRSWRPPTAADVLILGDSFTNVFSDPELGWGTGAGLAEQLSFELDRPVARLALNAGGAAASRRALGRELRAGRDRLGETKVVIYQFATRELAQGSWPILEPLLPSPR